MKPYIVDKTPSIISKCSISLKHNTKLQLKFLTNTARGVTTRPRPTTTTTRRLGTLPKQYTNTDRGIAMIFQGQLQIPLHLTYMFFRYFMLGAYWL